MRTWLLILALLSASAFAEERQAEQCGDSTYHQAGFCPSVLSSASGAATGATTGNCSASSTESDGTRYVVATSDNIPLTCAQIAAASGGSVVAGNSSVESGGAFAVSLTGLTTDAAHYCQVCNVSPELWDSNVVVSSSFTPTAAGYSGSNGTYSWTASSLAEDVILTVTDSGSGFGTKPGGAAPLLKWDFGSDGSLTPHSDSAISSFTDFHATQAGIDSGGGHFDGATNAAEYIFQGSTSEPFIWYNTAILTNRRSSPEPYIYMRVRQNWTASQAYSSSTSWNWKHIRVLSTGNQNANPGMSLLTGQNSSNGNPRYQWRHAGTNGGADGGSSDTRYVGGIDNADTNWHRDEYLLTPSTTTNGGIKTWRDGGVAANHTDIQTDDLGGDGTEEFARIEMFREQNVWASTSWRMYLDFLYIDDSPAQVFLTDSATWNENGSDVRELQTPTLWNAGAIHVRLKKGALTALSGSHLHVRKSDKSMLYIGQM